MTPPTNAGRSERRRVNVTCRTPGCTASPKADHLTLHSVTDEALAATPTSWPSYAQNQAELARRAAR